MDVYKQAGKTEHPAGSRNGGSIAGFFFKHTFSLCSGSSSNKQVRVFSIPTHVWNLFWQCISMPGSQILSRFIPEKPYPNRRAST